MQEIKITESTGGGRLDKAIFKYLDKAHAGFVYKMLRKKNITLNDKRAQGNEILKAGDSIKLYLAEETIAQFRTLKGPGKEKKAYGTDIQNSVCMKAQRTIKEPMTDFPSWILYEDAHLLAFNKPAGILSQRNTARDISANDLLKTYLGSDLLFTPGISNRLDRNTSGIMLAGKDPASVRALDRAIRDRSLRKYYLCLVKGMVTQEGELEGYLIKDAGTNTVKIYNTEDEIFRTGKDSDMKRADRNTAYIRTGVRVLSSNESISLLEIDLITGKPHQIRAHLAHLGHPVLGDSKYGDSAFNRNYQRHFDLPGQMLHAFRVTFDHMDGILEYLNGTTIECAPPPVFQEIAERNGLCLHGVPADCGVHSSSV